MAVHWAGLIFLEWFQNTQISHRLNKFKANMFVQKGTRHAK